MNRKIISIIAAVLFSVVLWGSVSLSDDYFTSVAIPVSIIELPQGYSAGYVSLNEISLRLKGDGWKLAALSLRGDIEYKISADADSGRKFIRLRDEIDKNDWLTSGIQVYDMYPDTASVIIERIITEKLKIQPNFKLSFKANYGLASPVSLKNDSVIVYGTKSSLWGIDSIPTVDKEISDLERKHVEQIELLTIKGINYQTNYTTATFDVQRIVDRDFNDIEVEIRNVPKERDLLLFPNKISIVLRGGINVLGKLGENEFSPYIEYNEVLNDTTGSIEPIITIPAYTRLVTIKPNRLKYIIKKY